MGIRIFNRKNVNDVSNCGGNYVFYDKNRRLIYTGVASGNKGKQWGSKPSQRYQYGLKHRLQSYYQKDDFKVHNEKKWRGEIAYFDCECEPNAKKRKGIEHRLKRKTKYNIS